jgi:hypothetical protein
MGISHFTKGGFLPRPGQLTLGMASPEVSPMTPRLFDSLVGALIRIGLLLALVIMLMAENAQAARSSSARVTFKSAGVALEQNSFLHDRN